MNYYQYQRRAPQRKKTDYIKPLIIAIFFIAILIGLWKLLGLVFGGDDSSQQNLSSISLEIESGDANIQTNANEEWETITGDSLDVYEGESIQTNSDGRVTLNFLDGSVLRLDKNSELNVQSLSSDEATLPFEEGKLWLDTSNGTGSTLTLSTKYLEVIASTGSRFSLTAPGDLYVLTGDVKVNVLEGNKTIETINVDADQQISLTQSTINNLSEGLEKDILFALDEDFKKSSWYQWNTQKDGLSTSDEEVADEDENEEDADAESEEDPEEEEEDSEDEDTETLDTPKITEPGSNGDEVTLESTEQFIKGTVASGTVAVVVNDYQLQGFKKGDNTFVYRANTSIGNLKVGKNTYNVIAKDEDDNESEAGTITLILPENLDDTEEEEENETEDEATGDVSITAPNSGNDLTTSDVSFVISGSVPSNTARVLVNGYQLQAFQSGGTSFKYNASTSLETMQVDQNNSYNVEAYDEDGNLLGSDTINIEHQSNTEPEAEDNNQEAQNLSLSISMPTTAVNYETTLNQITLGGAVSPSAEAIYVNNQKIDYTPGSSEWSLTVDLEAGKNTFNVFAEATGQKLLLDSINVVYNQ